MSANVEVDEMMFFVKMLNSLPEEFKVERSIMQTWEEPDFVKAREILLDQQAALLKTKQSHDTASPFVEGTVFQMSERGSTNMERPAKRRKLNLECFYCQQKGHIRPECSQQITDECAGIFRKKIPKGESGKVIVMRSESSGGSSSRAKEPEGATQFGTEEVSKSEEKEEVSEGFCRLQ